MTALGAIPIYMDEGLITGVEAEEFAALGMFNGITMKVARCGGLWHAVGMARMLEELFRLTEEAEDVGEGAVPLAARRNLRAASPLVAGLDLERDPRVAPPREPQVKALLAEAHRLV